MQEKAKILVVDDESNNLMLLQAILKRDYHIFFANNGRQAISATKEHKPDLILLDIMMPDMDGYEVCEALKADPETQTIPVIFVTAMSTPADEARGFDVGGVDYITKPLSLPIILRRVKTHLSLVRADTLERLATSAIHMLGEAGHYNDTDTGLHIWRMAAYAGALARASGWSPKQVSALEMAAPMHDTGKIGISDSILKAPRKLTKEEWVVMKTHTTIGHSILSQSDNSIFALAATICLQHHEKWDGSGYPDGLSQEAISEASRIVAIADVFDALTMKRPYKEAWSVEEAMAEVRKCAGSHFDAGLVTTFEAIFPQIVQIKQDWDQKSSV